MNVNNFWYGDVIGVMIYPNGVEVVRTNYKTHEGHKRVRGEITALTRKSVTRLTHVVLNSRVEFKTMVTLTYPMQYPVSGKVVKGHLNTFLTRLRSFCRGVLYVWWLEFQRRFAPHIHLLIDVACDKYLRGFVCRAWHKIGLDYEADFTRLRDGSVVSLSASFWSVLAHKKTCEAVREIDGARRYVVKYMSKMHQKTIPDFYCDVGRWWGCSRAVKPEVVGYAHGNEARVRDLLSSHGRDMSHFDVLPKYCFVSGLTR